MPNYQDLLNKLTQLQTSPILPNGTPSLIQRPENQMNDEDTKDKVEADEMPLPAEIPEDLKINELPDEKEAGPIKLNVPVASTLKIPSAVTTPEKITIPSNNLKEIEAPIAPTEKYQELLTRFKELSTPSENENIEGLKKQQDITNEGLQQATMLQGANQIAQGFAKRVGGEVGSGEAGVKSLKDQYISQLQNYKDLMAAAKSKREDQLKAVNQELGMVEKEYDAGRASFHDKLNLEKNKHELERQGQLDKAYIQQQQANLTKLQQQITEGNYQLEDIKNEHDPKNILSTYARFKALENEKQKIAQKEALAKQLGIELPKESLPEIPENASYSDLKKMGLISDKVGADALTLTSMMRMKELENKTRDADLRADKFRVKSGQDFNKAINPALAPKSSNLGQAQSNLQQAEKLESLIYDLKTGKIKDLNNVQQKELALGLTTMLSRGGRPALELVKGLQASSGIGDANAALQWFLNKPIGAKQQEFTKLYADMFTREKITNKEQLKQMQLAGVVGNLNYLRNNPEDAAIQLKRNGLNPEEVKAALEQNTEDISEMTPFLNKLNEINERETERILGDNKAKTSSDKIKVTNGKETLLIDPSDLKHAKADGYEEVP